MNSPKMRHAGHDYQQEASHYIREFWVRFFRRFAGALARSIIISKKAPGRLTVAPTDLNAADAYVAEEMLHGRYLLAGRTLDADGAEPFGLEPPSVAFDKRLHSFGWLRNFRATKSDVHYAFARQLVNEWILSHGRPFEGVAWEADIVAQRLSSWFSHSPVILKDAEIGFYRRFLRNLAIQTRYLRKIAATTQDGEPRLRAYITLAMASLVMPLGDKEVRRAARLLDRELERQILPDGGHISRDPRMLLDILLELLPLRQTYVNLGFELPAKLIPTIDRMYPALRFFRHEGGELALFNGATVTLANELASVLRYDETSGVPFRALPYMHYHRLASNGTTVLIDTGKPFSSEMSKIAHCGCLSFEMSSGKNRFIINSGSPRFAAENYRQLARSTAAHSVVTVGDRSSMRISKSEYLGPRIVGGVSEIAVDRSDNGGGTEAIRLRHDGYLDFIGLIYERDFQVNAAGTLIRGRERFLTAEGAEPMRENQATAMARFHIPPNVSIRARSDNEVDLEALDGEIWSMSCIDAPIDIADDIFFADASGIRSSKQLVIAFDTFDIAEIQWVLAQKKRPSIKPE